MEDKRKRIRELETKYTTLLDDIRKKQARVDEVCHQQIQIEKEEWLKLQQTQLQEYKTEIKQYIQEEKEDMDKKAQKVKEDIQKEYQHNRKRAYEVVREQVLNNGYR